MAKDAGDVVVARLLSSCEFCNAIKPAASIQILCRRGRDAVPVAVVTYLVFLEGIDNISAATLFERAGLFTNNFEGRLDFLFREPVSQLQSGIIAGWENVILGIKPEDDIDGRLLVIVLGSQAAGDDRQQDQTDC